MRSGPVADADRARIVRALGSTRDDVVDLAWVDNGPGWVGVLLRGRRAPCWRSSPTSPRFTT